MKIAKVLIFLLLILLVVVSYLGYGETAKLFYTSESATYLTELSEINMVLTIAFLLSIGFILFCKFNSKILRISLLSVALIFWLLAGRKVGVKKFEDGRVNYGWYSFETGKFFLCDKKNAECETVVANQTSIEELSFWRVNIKNEDINETIFIGPITWIKVIEVLKTNIGNGTSTE